MPADMAALAADLAAESAVSRALVAGLDEAGWHTPTPAAGWDIADQISHLAYFDEVTVRSAVGQDEFLAERAAAEADNGINPDTIAARFRDRTGAQLLAWFDTARADLIGTFAGLDPRARLPWFGPAMSAASSLTARIMETWAHTQDIADALGATREPTGRLRHVAHIGVGARAFSYAVHGQTPPAVEIRVELTGPDGTAWTWGPPEAENRVTGPALDFCLLVTQRRHRDDLALAIDGQAATEWMAIAQAFAGAAGTGRPPQGLGGEHMRRPVRIANCSGFYGDRIAAAREMLDQGSSPVDVLTGDYLAELTMLILWKARRKDPSLGYATTFLRQMEDVLGTCLERGVKVVANAGGLNPGGLAAKVTELAERLGLNARVAYITGDDLAPVIGDLQAAGHKLANLDTGLPLAKADLPVVTANAYLGGWGITAALEAGADVVICPRVTDASLVTGPAAWWHGWRRADWDALAGAVAAGHVIECGPQACGGNYSFLDEITDRRYPGFPVAEVAADGSSVITKHDGTGGLVSTGTVTAQLLYEIGDPAYLNPDVVAHFDTIRLTQDGPDRVALTGTRGSPPPRTLKVAINMLGGYRNTTTMVLTGLDIEEKARYATALLTEVLGGTEQFDEFDVRLLRFDHPDAPTNEQATAHLRVTVKDTDERKVGRAFSNAATELALAGYAGFHTTTPPTPASAFGVYWPTLIPGDLVTQAVHVPGGETQLVRHHERPDQAPTGRQTGSGPSSPAAEPPGLDAARPTENIPLGRLCGARSGDKGGDANVGLWAVSPRAYAWLRGYLTADRLPELLTEAAGLPIERYELPNLLALNFVIHGLLTPGVSGTTRPDAQAKGLGEYLRSRLVPVPADLAQ